MCQKVSGRIFVLAVVGASLLLSASSLGFAAAKNTAERSLAGIRVGRKYTTILQKYGNPTRIEVGAGGGGTTTTLPGGAGGGMMGGRPGGMMGGGGPGMMGGGGPGMMGAGGRPGGMMGGAGGPGMMGGAGGPGMMGGGGPGMMGGRPSGMMGGAGGPGMMGGAGGPGMMGGGGPGMMGGAGGPGMMGGAGGPGMMGRGPMTGGPGSLPAVTGGASTTPGGIGPITVTEGPSQVVRWIYELKNVVLEFTIDSDGTILQVTAIGERWPTARTSKGVTLGTSYKDALRRHGFPKAHSSLGVNIIRADYSSSQRMALTFQDKKVVSITVALVQ
ncbi:MAG: hypothetical protein IT210_24645 [Armatimonadetes bacterium]|nr:hypothetical protein [Armatimonadota bacterium]